MELYIKYSENGEIQRISKESYNDDILFENAPENILFTPEKYKIEGGLIIEIPETPKP